MVALAGGLAFGLGSRETAAQIVNKQIVNNWYSRSQQAAPRITQPAADIRQRPRQEAADRQVLCRRDDEPELRLARNVLSVLTGAAEQGGPWQRSS
jgi:hypothetical protein